MAKPLFDADFIISLPKLKTHSGCIYTGGSPTAGNVYPAKKTLMSTDPLALDTTAALIFDTTIEKLYELEGNLKNEKEDI